jgi:hypothetical protein
MTNENQTRLYFTIEKICIGSYDEVAQYEAETKQSYWASEFFTLPPGYSGVGKSAREIQEAISEYKRESFLEKRGFTYARIADGFEAKGLKLVALEGGDYRIKDATNAVYGETYCSCLGIAKRKLEAALPIKKGDIRHLKIDPRIHSGEFKNPQTCYIRDGWMFHDTALLLDIAEAEAKEAIAK